MWFLFNIEKGAWNFLMKIFWTVFSAHIIPTLCTWWMHSRESASCPEFDDQQQHFLLFLSFFLSFRPNMFSESCPDLAVSKSSGLLPIFARGKQLENIVRSGRLCHFVTSTKKEISWLRRVESVHDMMLTDWALAIGSISCLDANVRHLQRSASSSPHVLCAKVDFFQLFHEWEREREREREREEEEEESRLTPKLCMPFWWTTSLRLVRLGFFPRRHLPPDSLRLLLS